MDDTNDAKNDTSGTVAILSTLAGSNAVNTVESFKLSPMYCGKSLPNPAGKNDLSSNHNGI
jgi:hypothetical protein